MRNRAAGVVGYHAHEKVGGQRAAPEAAEGSLPEPLYQHDVAATFALFAV